MTVVASLSGGLASDMIENFAHVGDDWLRQTKALFPRIVISEWHPSYSANMTGRRIATGRAICRTPALAVIGIMSEKNAPGPVLSQIYDSEV